VTGPGRSGGQAAGIRETMQVLLSLRARHRAPFRHVKPLSAAERPAAEVTTGGGPARVDGAAPSFDPATVSRFLPQVTAGGIDQKDPVRFPESPLPQVMDLVGFTLSDGKEREPAAALAAAAAGTGLYTWTGGVHSRMFAGTGKKNRDSVRLARARAGDYQIPAPGNSGLAENNLPRQGSVSCRFPRIREAPIPKTQSPAKITNA
jgi:hypothetical protein